MERLTSLFSNASIISKFSQGGVFENRNITHEFNLPSFDWHFNSCDTILNMDSIFLYNYCKLFYFLYPMPTRELTECIQAISEGFEIAADWPGDALKFN